MELKTSWKRKVREKHLKSCLQQQGFWLRIDGSEKPYVAYLTGKLVQPNLKISERFEILLICHHLIGLNSGWLLLQDLEKEYQRQAYFQCKMPDGEITAVKFAEIMKVLRGHKLSPFVRNYLLTVRQCLCVAYTQVVMHVHFFFVQKNDCGEVKSISVFSFGVKTTVG